MSQPTSDHAPDAKFDRNLKRKVTIILGMVVSVFSGVGMLSIVAPSIAPLAVVMGSGAIGTVAAIVAAE